MAVYLLLDTNILRRLASKTDPSSLLQHLDRLVRGNYINLLVPETLKKEWQKHGREQKAIITKALRKTQKEARERAWGTTENNEFTDEQLRIKEQALHRQIDMIDDLVVNHGIQIPVTADVLLAVHKQKESGKAPFHKKNSESDALIIFSALTFLRSENVSSFYFVSDNTSDFAVTKDGKWLLHRDIQNHFQDISTEYFEHIKAAFDVLAGSGLPRYADSMQSFPNRVKNTIKVDRSKTIIDQLYEYIEKRSHQLMFHPKKILLEHFPFITADAFNFLHRPFTVITDNRSLYRLLSSVLVTDTDVTPTHPNPIILQPGDKEKIIEIINFLRFNLLENVAFEQGNSVPVTFEGKGSECDCPLCTYKRFDFKALITLLNPVIPETAEDIDATMKRAYGFYKTGRFADAARILVGLKNNWKDLKNLKYYIVCMNLVNLGFIIRQSYLRNGNFADVLTEISSIDLTEIYADCLQPAYQPLLDWLHEKKFFTESFTGLHEALKKITDHFQGRNTGYNENTNELIEHYFSCERFLSANSVIYDLFGDFYSLTDLFTEGLFASYGCNDFLSGKLTYLSDDLIEKLLVHGNAGDMVKYYRRYKLEGIRYRPNATGTTTKDRIKKLIASYPLLADEYEKNKDSFQEYFWDHYSELIFKSLTILGMIEMSEDDMNELAGNICDMLETANHIQYFHLSKFIQFFVHEKKNTISEKLLSRFFILGINDDRLIPDNFTDNLKMVIEKRGFKIEIPATAFKKFETAFLSLKDDQRVRSWHTIGNVFIVTAKDRQRKAIRKFVDISLETKFYGPNFYLASMFGIIEPNEKYFDLYTDELVRIIARGQQQRPFDNYKFYVDSRINEYFNFLFKFDKQLPEKIRSILPAMGKYYVWLSDPDNFDYSQFNRNWLDYYFTLYFKRHFRKSNVLKQFLLSSFKTKFDLDLEHKFMLMYNYND